MIPPQIVALAKLGLAGVCLVLAYLLYKFVMKFFKYVGLDKTETLEVITKNTEAMEGIKGAVVANTKATDASCALQHEVKNMLISNGRHS